MGFTHYSTFHPLWSFPPPIYKVTRLDKGTVIGKITPINEYDGLEINNILHVEGLPPEEEIIPIRRHEMTEEEFSKISISDELTPEQYKQIKDLICRYRDVFCYGDADSSQIQA